MPDTEDAGHGDSGISLTDRLTRATDAARSAIAQFGPAHPDTARALTDLAAVHHAGGDPAGAMLYATNASAIYEQLGDVSAGRAAALVLVGHVYYSIGDYAAAIGKLQYALAYQRCVPALRRAPAADIAAADIARDLASAYWLMARKLGLPRYIAKSRRLYRWALAVCRVAAGDHRPRIATLQHDLALLELAARSCSPADATIRLRAALDLRVAALGADHLAVSDSLTDLGGILAIQGELQEAERVLQRAVAIRRPALHAHHRLIGTSLSALARIYSETRRHDLALAAARESTAIADTWLARLSLVASDQHLADGARMVSEENRQNVRIALLHGGPDAITWLAEVLIRRHGLTRRAALLRRAALVCGEHRELKPAAERLRQVERELMRLDLGQGNGSGAESAAAPFARVNLLTERDHLQQTIAFSLAQAGPSPKPQDLNLNAIRRALPADRVLVHYVQLPADAGESGTAETSALTRAEYFAVVVGADPSQCHVIALDPLVDVDALIARYRIGLGVMTAADRERQDEVTRSTTGSGAGISGGVRSAIAAAARHLSVDPQPLDEDTDTAHRLQEAIFAPLLPYLRGCRRLAVVPDGELARLPLNVLPLGPDRRVIDDFEIGNLGSADDLLRSESPGGAGTALVVGDPDFDLHGEAVGPLNRPFARLAGTRQEIRTVAGLLGVDAVAGARATVPCVTGAVSPRVLHVATHACAWDFGGEGQALSRFDPSDRTNPLLRSGLVLAGANTWLRSGSPVADAGYGMLFAQEVLGMDLRATELVVLSACETGLGHVFSGEGVFGLGRAFAIAGARTVVMSLWRIPDQATSALMNDFYSALCRGVGRAAALREAQLRLKQDYASPFFWGSFICEGETGPIAALGSPASP